MNMMNTMNAMKKDTVKKMIFIIEKREIYRLIKCSIDYWQFGGRRCVVQTV